MPGGLAAVLEANKDKDDNDVIKGDLQLQAAIQGDAAKRK